jgi:hypothetical protein
MTPRDPFREPEDEMFEDDLVIRPFLLTGGRTVPVRDGLRVETLLQSQPGQAATRQFEERRIVELCRRPTSLAEIAAALRVPIGVTRVLVADLIATGAVTMVQPGTLSLSLIERIRDRVRAL